MSRAKAWADVAERDRRIVIETLRFDAREFEDEARSGCAPTATGWPVGDERHRAHVLRLAIRALQAAAKKPRAK